MIKILGYEVTAFQRKPGYWRASITPEADHRPSNVGTSKTLSFLTEEDSISEDEAIKAASAAIKGLPR